MKKDIKVIEIDPQVQETIAFLEESFLSPKKKRLLKKARDKQGQRNGHRAVYDLPPVVIAKIKTLADVHETTASQVARLAMELFLLAAEKGEVDFEKYKVRIEGNPRYHYLLREFFINPFHGVPPEEKAEKG